MIRIAAMRIFGEFGMAENHLNGIEPAGIVSTVSSDSNPFLFPVRCAVIPELANEISLIRSWNGISVAAEVTI